eukprot:COSAG01_NODE_12146_length_1794_cov_1.220059_2_plen_101_part_00
MHAGACAVPILMQKLLLGEPSGIQYPDLEELDYAEKVFYAACEKLAKIYRDQDKAAKWYATEVIQIQNDEEQLHKLSVDLIENPIPEEDEIRLGIPYISK